MKKLLSFIFVTIMILSTMTCVTAAENDNRETIVSLTIDESMESYTLIIPATVTIDPVTKSGSLYTELKDVSLVWNDELSVTMSSANPDLDNYGAFLVNTEDPNKKIHYRLYDIDGAVYVEKSESSSGTNAAEYQKDDNYSDGEFYNFGEIKLIVDGEYPGSGTYTDTLTFTVTVS